MLTKGQRSSSLRKGFLEFESGVELTGGVKLPVSDRGKKGLAGLLSCRAAVGCSDHDVLERVQSSFSLRNGFADFARGVSLAASVESPISDRTKNGLSASKFGLNGFADLLGVADRCHQCDVSMFRVLRHSH